jgi:hypothetical protein
MVETHRAGRVVKVLPPEHSHEMNTQPSRLDDVDP